MFYVLLYDYILSDILNFIFFLNYYNDMFL
jgi:hypothetical protein